jgi:hypothetical protein
MMPASFLRSLVLNMPHLSSLSFSHMATPYLGGLDGFTSGTLDSPVTPGGDGVSARRTNALSTKLTSVLSSSYADYEIRDALRLLDARGVHNDEETRRNLKLNAQKEVIDCNAKIVDDFGYVAEVCTDRLPHTVPLHSLDLRSMYLFSNSAASALYSPPSTRHALQCVNTSTQRNENPHPSSTKRAH